MVLCEVCPHTEIKEADIKKIGGIIMCPSCFAKEKALQDELNKPENVAKRVAEVSRHVETQRQIAPIVLGQGRALSQAMAIDKTIEVRQDLFNAQTVSCSELEKIIKSDESITNKNDALYNALTERFNQFRKIIFDLNEEMVNKNTEMRAVQTYMNELYNKLTVQEREKYKSFQPNYNPAPVKVSKPRENKAAKPKVDKQLLRMMLSKLHDDLRAKGLGVVVDTLKESTIHTMCVSRGITVEVAINEMRTNLGLN